MFYSIFRYLDWTLDESTGVRKQDRTTVFSNVARNDAGLLLAKSFLFDKVDEIYKKYVKIANAFEKGFL